MRRHVSSALSWAYLVALYAFIFLPVAVLVLFSFQDGRLPVRFALESEPECGAEIVNLSARGMLLAPRGGLALHDSLRFRFWLQALRCFRAWGKPRSVEPKSILPMPRVRWSSAGTGSSLTFVASHSSTKEYLSDRRRTWLAPPRPRTGRSPRHPGPVPSGSPSRAYEPRCRRSRATSPERRLA